MNHDEAARLGQRDPQTERGGSPVEYDGSIGRVIGCRSARCTLKGCAWGGVHAE